MAIAAKKFKVSDIAKNFELQSKEIIEILSKFTDGEKKPSTSVEEKDLEILFDLITKDHSVDNFDAYFSSAEEKPKKQVNKPQEKSNKQQEERAAKAQGGKPQSNTNGKPAAQNQAYQHPRKLF